MKMKITSKKKTPVSVHLIVTSKGKEPLDLETDDIGELLRSLKTYSIADWLKDLIDVF
jgi:hypothetical protein